MDFGGFSGSLGRLLVIFGLCLVVIGALLIFAPKIPLLGRLPGDIVIRRENFTFYFPVATCIVISLLFTILLRIFRG
jgi:hypothetical protein